MWYIVVYAYVVQILLVKQSETLKWDGMNILLEQIKNGIALNI